MARRKKKKKQKPSEWFSFGNKKSKSKRKAKARPVSIDLSYKIFLGIVAVGCVVGGIVIGFIFLDKHVKASSPVLNEYGQLELVGKPAWFNNQLVNKVETAAGAKSFLIVAMNVRYCSIHPNLLVSVERKYLARLSAFIHLPKWKMPLHVPTSFPFRFRRQFSQVISILR